MEDLIGLLIFLIFFGSRIFGSFNKTEQKSQPRKKKTLTDWMEELEKQAFPKEVVEQRGTTPRPAASQRTETRLERPKSPPREAAEPRMPIHPPLPERTGVTGTTLRKPSSRAKTLIGPGELKQAIIMKEILGPPKARKHLRGPRF